MRCWWQRVATHKTKTDYASLQHELCRSRCPSARFAPSLCLSAPLLLSSLCAVLRWCAHPLAVDIASAANQTGVAHHRLRFALRSSRAPVAPRCLETPSCSLSAGYAQRGKITLLSTLAVVPVDVGGEVSIAPVAVVSGRVASHRGRWLRCVATPTSSGNTARASCT